MSTSRRIVIAIVILVFVIGSILVIQSFRRGGHLYRICNAGEKKFSEGCILLSSGGKKLADFCRKNSEGLKKTAFRDKKENKLQEGWLLRDVILLYVKKEDMSPDTLVRIASSSRGKKAEVRWKDISDEQNRVLLALTKQGTLKLVSVMKDLDAREQWVQDVDKIEVVKK
jgi:hypothetical protein